MNYYEHHLGDYDGATAHLSWLEDCAYRRMLGLYYRTEAPLPADPKQVCRLVRATSKPERDAVQQVLTEFFELADDGWHNARCDEDVASYHELEPEREAKRENAKERQRRARARRAELFETLRGHNIVPPYDTTTRALEALLSRVTSALPVTEPVTPVTCDDTATHTHLPPPTSQTQITPTEVKGKAAARPRPPDRPDDVASGVWDDWLQLRRAKKAPVTATVLDGARGEAVKAGLTLEAFLRVWCSRGSQGLQAEWLKPHERGRSAATPDEPEWRREQRERTAEFAGPAAAKRPPETVDVETINADARIVG